LLPASISSLSFPPPLFFSFSLLPSSYLIGQDFLARRRRVAGPPLLGKHPIVLAVTSPRGLLLNRSQALLTGTLFSLMRVPPLQGFYGFFSTKFSAVSPFSFLPCCLFAHLPRISTTLSFLLFLFFNLFALGLNDLFRETQPFLYLCLPRQPAGGRCRLQTFSLPTLDCTQLRSLSIPSTGYCGLEVFCFPPLVDRAHSPYSQAASSRPDRYTFFFPAEVRLCCFTSWPSSPFLDSADAWPSQMSWPLGLR